SGGPVSDVSDSPNPADTGDDRRVWAIASVHGEAERLERLHHALLGRLQPGDRIVYLGNLIGRGPAIGAAIDRLLRFRRAVLAGQYSFACELAYLRGSQEEMWQKLLQLQFAPDPKGTVEWLLSRGVGPVLETYGSSAIEARRQAAAGPLGLTRWTNQLRAAIQARAGHVQFYASLRRAAYTHDGALLFVNSGLDPERPLETQRDSFWWNSSAFERIDQPYGSYKKVVRGFDPAHPGLRATDWTITVDGGAGYGGPLLAACVGLDGQIIDHLEV
ncbi:MAG: hypothetical protein AAF495_20775, partial [Pseudomonadota bacterium]